METICMTVNQEGRRQMIKGIHGRNQRVENMRAPEEQGRRSTGLRREVREGARRRTQQGRRGTKGNQRNSQTEVFGSD